MDEGPRAVVNRKTKVADALPLGNEETDNETDRDNKPSLEMKERDERVSF